MIVLCIFSPGLDCYHIPRRSVHSGLPLVLVLEFRELHDEGLRVPLVSGIVVCQVLVVVINRVSFLAELVLSPDEDGEAIGLFEDLGFYSRICSFAVVLVLVICESRNETSIY